MVPHFTVLRGILTSMNAAVLSGFEEFASLLGVGGGVFWMLLAAATIWTLIFKGFALWHAARNYQRYWFVVLLVVNTFGLLEIIYLIWFRADKEEGRTQSLFNMPGGPVSSPSA
jgi:methionyl-tRNA synthetase